MIGLANIKSQAYKGLNKPSTSTKATHIRRERHHQHPWYQLRLHCRDFGRGQPERIQRLQDRHAIQSVRQRQRHKHSSPAVGLRRQKACVARDLR